MISNCTAGTGWAMGPLDERGNEGGGAGGRGAGRTSNELRCGHTELEVLEGHDSKMGALAGALSLLSQRAPRQSLWGC